MTPDSGMIGSVAVDSIIDMGNTDYCILGYDVADCDGIPVDHKDWDSRPNSESSIHLIFPRTDLTLFRGAYLRLYTARGVC